MNEDGGPIFRQIAAQLENAIVDGSLPEESQAPSTNELAAFHRINPATAAKGLNRLVDDGVLYKRRGVGMFVATGARDQLLKRRRSEFADQYLQPLLTEAAKLGISGAEITCALTIEGDDGVYDVTVTTTSVEGDTANFDVQVADEPR